MSQVPPYEPANSAAPTYSSPPTVPPPAPERRGGWLPWIVGILGLFTVAPCLCCSGCLLVASTFKEITLSNGEHLGGPPMNVRFDYKFNNDGHGPGKAYYIVAKASTGATRERPISGGFGITRIPLRGTWTFSDPLDLGPEDNKEPIQVWIESEDMRGDRGTASNTLTIYPKK